MKYCFERDYDTYICLKKLKYLKKFDFLHKFLTFKEAFFSI